MPMSKADATRLVDREDVLEKLFRRVVAYAARRIGADDAEDVAQETLLLLREKYAHLEDPTDLVKVIMTIASFKVRGVLRDRGRRRTEPIDDKLVVADGAPNPETLVLTRPSGIPHTRRQPVRVRSKPVDNKPVDDKPVDDKPVDDKPVDDKPVDDKPVDDKPVGTPDPEITADRKRQRPITTLREFRKRSREFIRLKGRATEPIHRAPGFKLRAFAEFFFSPKTYEKVLEPVLRDLQDEHMEALAEGQIGKARWVRIRGTCSFWAAVAAQLPTSLIKWLKAFVT